MALSASKSSINAAISGGVMGKLISEFDWAATPIGPAASWSESLKNLVSLMLVNRFPMLLWWGEQYVQIYNDAYIPVLGRKHPSPGLGRPGYECWDEIWSVIGPLVDTPFKGGPATWMDDILLKVNRNNFVEETHFTIAYSPVPDPTSPTGIGGVLATVNEITDEIIAKRQMETLRKLGNRKTSNSSTSDVYAHTARVLLENNFDVPFAFIHRIDPQRKAWLDAVVGISPDHASLPTEIDLEKEASDWQDLARSANEGIMVIADNRLSPSDIPLGAWDSPATKFAYLPIREANRGVPIAVVTLALNPYRKIDDSFGNFLQLIADQISSGVTNVMAYEKEKHRAEALAELDKAKTTFFSNVSHELRTPLTLILGPMDDLLAQRQDKIAADRDVIALMQRNAIRLQKLVNMLLDFARIEAGRMEMVFTPTNISKLTAELASNFTSLTEKAGLILEVDCPDFREPIWLDQDMWEKIVLNLLSNAFKFTFEGKISIGMAMHSDSAELTVADTGIGMSVQDQQRIFERFHRIPNTRSRSFEGSGIGLSLVSELVKLHGGTIQVESAPGNGTTFNIRIPRGSAHLPKEQVREANQESLPTSPKANLILAEALRWFPNEIKEPAIDDQRERTLEPEKPTIILADDNADMRDYIKSILTEYCHVLTAGNGPQALELARQSKPDLVLSDIMMPGFDGFKLLEKMREDPNLRTVPVIFLSARAGEDARIEGLMGGADDYLTKPFTRNELIARVNSNIRLSRIRQEIEEAIRQSEARLRALVIATSDVIYRMSPDWSVMWQLEGRDFLQDTGEPLTEWQKKYIHPKDYQRVLEAIREAISKKSVFQLEHQVYRADGTLGWTFSRAVPILDRQGEIIEWFGAASDITDRKLHLDDLERRVGDRTKQLSEAVSALKKSNSNLQQFAHVASHDLKEPVRKIKTYTYLLIDNAENPSPERRGSYLNKILSSAERMSTMIDGVLTYSSVGGATVEFTPVDLNKVFVDIKSDLELLIQEKGAKLTYPELPVLFGGRLPLYQLFYNLISNSLKFSSPARTPEVAIDWHPDGTGKNCIITVTDNGIGFDPAHNERVFETFSRLNPKDSFDGTGLGLSLCRRIAERHNGSIRADGKKGEGVTFTIELPVVNQKKVEK